MDGTRAAHHLLALGMLGMNEPIDHSGKGRIEGCPHPFETSLQFRPILMKVNLHHRMVPGEKAFRNNDGRRLVTRSSLSQ
jgi:hypothetical protein